MASPVGYRHSFRDVDASFWAKFYASFTLGTLVGGNATVMLDELGEHQPDCVLIISEAAGGQSHLDEEFIKCAPELVIEVSRSTRRLDLGPRKLDYEWAGVLEYLFVGVEPDEVRWFVRRGEHFEQPPGEDGILRSEAFPGLWLDPAALFASDGRGLIATLERGLATPEHAEFVARLPVENEEVSKMSTVEHVKQTSLPSLVNGERLDNATFTNVTRRCRLISKRNSSEEWFTWHRR